MDRRSGQDRTKVPLDGQKNGWIRQTKVHTGWTDRRAGQDKFPTGWTDRRAEQDKVPTGWTDRRAGEDRALQSCLCMGSW